MKIVPLPQRKIDVSGDSCSDDDLERKFQEVRDKVKELRDAGMDISSMVVLVDARPFDKTKDNYYLGRFALGQSYSQTVAMLEIAKHIIVDEMFR